MKNRTINRLVYILIFLYFIFKPIYFFPSGMPQIADFCLIVLVGLLRFSKNIYKASEETQKDLNTRFKNIYPFIAWVVVINFLWFTYLEDSSILKPIVFYIFNVIALWIMKELYFIYENEIIKKISTFIAISCAIQGFLSLVLTVGGKRATLLFNNPNQLGMYALMCLSYLLIFNRQIGYRKIKVIAIISSVYLILISLSKAAIIGAVVELIIYFIFFCKMYKLKLVLVLVALMIELFNFSTYIYEYVYSRPFIHNAINRIENMTKEEDSDLGSGRGYDRINEIGFKVIFGVGEGANYRFEALSGKEIHSAYASILCYYGIIGSLLLLTYIVKTIPIKLPSFRYYILLIGIVLYGFTHQIWRNTLLWILLVLISIASNYSVQGIDTEEKSEEMEKS